MLRTLYMVALSLLVVLSLVNACQLVRLERRMQIEDARQWRFQEHVRRRVLRVEEMHGFPARWDGLAHRHVYEHILEEEQAR